MIESGSSDSPYQEALVLDGASREVLRQSSGQPNGGDASVSSITSCALKDSSHFDSCLTTVSSDCFNLDDWLESCTETTLTCHE